MSAARWPEEVLIDAVVGPWRDDFPGRVRQLQRDWRALPQLQDPGHLLTLACPACATAARLRAWEFVHVRREAGGWVDRYTVCHETVSRYAGDLAPVPRHLAVPDDVPRPALSNAQALTYARHVLQLPEAVMAVRTFSETELRRVVARTQKDVEVLARFTARAWAYQEAAEAVYAQVAPAMRQDRMWCAPCRAVARMWGRCPQCSQCVPARDLVTRGILAPRALPPPWQHRGSFPLLALAPALAAAPQDSAHGGATSTAGTMTGSVSSDRPATSRSSTPTK